MGGCLLSEINSERVNRDPRTMRLGTAVAGRTSARFKGLILLIWHAVMDKGGRGLCPTLGRLEPVTKVGSWGCRRSDFTNIHLHTSHMQGILIRMSNWA